ncbi:unannotated protein [freshwater metagenome]|uniref:Unannotated protein n=1 Tax=freshwater metagenome TaxID=449393 RepID=A0A6J7S1S6_9ZZZZ
MLRLDSAQNLLIAVLVICLHKVSCVELEFVAIPIGAVYGITVGALNEVFRSTESAAEKIKTLDSVVAIASRSAACRT